MIYAHTGTYEWSTKLIDLETQTYINYPHSSGESYGISYPDPSAVIINNAYPGIALGVIFNDGDADVIAEDRIPKTTAASATIDCSGYKAVWVNYGGVYYAGWGRLDYVDLITKNVYNLIMYSYGSRLNAPALSGNILTLSMNTASESPYYSVVGIK